MLPYAFAVRRSAFVACLLHAVVAFGGQAQVIGKDALVAFPESAHYSRLVNFMPVDGAEVQVDPPRFAWTYNPQFDPAQTSLREFRFQLAADKQFSKLLVDQKCSYNFYNMLAPLKASKCYWRVGYIDPQKGQDVFAWSRVRSFTIAPGAVEWDRSMLADADYLASKKHPRLLANRNARAGGDAAAEAQALADKAQHMIEERMNWTERYQGGFPRLAEAYDRLYETLTPRQRQTVVRAIDGYCEWVMDHFWWRKVNGRSWGYSRERQADVRPSAGEHIMPTDSAAKVGGSHSSTNHLMALEAALATYDHPDARWSREMLEVGLNYLIGHPYWAGSDDGCNEGSHYDGIVTECMLMTSLRVNWVFPELQIERNPYYRRVSRFWRYKLPVGMGNRFHVWGHQGNWGTHQCNLLGRIGLPLAYLGGDGAMLSHWKAEGEHWRGRYDLHGLPNPQETVEDDLSALFPAEGWVMAHSVPPSSPQAFEKGVGMVFQCRPRGGVYNHTQYSDVSFQLYAYGQSITRAGGLMWNKPYSTHSMSHNTILVDGIGQAQKHLTGYYAGRSWFGRIYAYKQAEDYVYCAGDATWCYPHEKFRVGGWWGGFDGNVYGKRDLAYLEKVRRHMLFVKNTYFVLFDELETKPSNPATYTWVYHIEPDTLRADPDDPLRFRYSVGDVDVHLVHVADEGSLKVTDLKGREGYRNPITGEDYRGPENPPTQPARFKAVIPAHHLWISNAKKRSEHNFMAVIYPVKPGTAAPKIRPINARTVEVAHGDEKDVITFDPDQRGNATIFVDLGQLEPLPAPNPYK